MTGTDGIAIGIDPVSVRGFGFGLMKGLGSNTGDSSTDFLTIGGVSRGSCVAAVIKFSFIL